MTSRNVRTMATGLLAAVALGGCAARTPETSAVRPATGDRAAIAATAAANADSARLPHTDADVRFMSGMVRHHAQAVLIAGWAPTHGANDAVRRLAERIVVGQSDESAIMERWLRKLGEPVPGADSSHHATPGTDAASGDHSAHMPGMLTAAQLAQLDGARGPEFDRLFLTLMIEHHRGALTMVDQLFGSQGAGQDETVFRLASDVYAEQTTEIARMERMLAALPSGSGSGSGSR